MRAPLRLWAFVLVFCVSAASLAAEKPRDRKWEIVIGRVSAAMRGSIGGFARTDGSCTYPYGLNIVDRARFSAAALLVEKGELDEAIAELESIAEESPDVDAVSAAHLSIGNIRCDRIGDFEGAIAEYRKVKGFLASHAAEGLARAYGSLGSHEQAARDVESLIEVAEGVRTKALILITLSDIYERAGQKQKAIETLRRVELLKTAEPRTAPPFDFAGLLERIARCKEEGNEEEAQKLIGQLKDPRMFIRNIWTAWKEKRRRLLRERLKPPRRAG